MSYWDSFEDWCVHCWGAIEKPQPAGHLENVCAGCQCLRCVPDGTLATLRRQNTRDRLRVDFRGTVRWLIGLDEEGFWEAREENEMVLRLLWRLR